MDTDQIEDFLKQFPSLYKHFGGVFSLDTLPHIYSSNLKKSIYFIINFDPSYKGGSHWICVKLNTMGPNYYFDSYGCPPFHPEILEFLNNNYEFNDIQLQHPLTTACGQWCLYYMIHDFCGFDESQLFEKFKMTNKCLLHTDYIMNSFLEDISGKDLTVVNRNFLDKQMSKEMRENLKLIPRESFYCQVLN